MLDFKKESFEYISILPAKIVNSNISITDLGPFEKISVDYPDYAKKVSSRISKKKVK